MDSKEFKINREAVTKKDDRKEWGEELLTRKL